MPAISRLVATAFSALSFGLLGWAAAHTITDALLAHDHGGAGRHVHGYLPSVLIAAGSLAIASLLAVFIAGLPGTPARLAPDAARHRRSGIRASAGLSAGAYMVAEFAEHWWSGGQQLPAPLVLLVGFAIYLVIGVGTSLLWRASVQAVQRAAGRIRVRRTAATTTGVIITAPMAARVLYAVHWPYVGAGRGPPLLSA